MKIKELIINQLSQNFNICNLVRLNHKNTAIAYGIICQTLLMISAITILQHPVQSIVGIFYGFFICLPASYYNMREYEKGYEYIVI